MNSNNFNTKYYLKIKRDINNNCNTIYFIIINRLRVQTNLKQFSFMFASCKLEKITKLLKIIYFRRVSNS